MMEEKIAYYPPPKKTAQKVAKQFLHNSDIFRNSPKNYQNILATFVRQFVAKCL